MTYGPTHSFFRDTCPLEDAIKQAGQAICSTGRHANTGLRLDLLLERESRSTSGTRTTRTFPRLARFHLGRADRDRPGGQVHFLFQQRHMVGIGDGNTSATRPGAERTAMKKAL